MILFDDGIIDEKDAKIDIEDRGYQFGDGIYEVIRVYRGAFFALHPHLERFQRSARELRIPLPFDPVQLSKRLETLVQANGLRDGIVYMQLTRGTASRSHAFPEEAKPLLTAYTKALPLNEEWQQSGIRTVTTEDIRWLRCDIKSINLLGNVLAKQEAREKGCQEAILVRDGKVTEGSASNIFIVKDGRVYTHPVNRYILNGITRTVVLELLRELEAETVEEPFSVSDLPAADEAFITSTTMEVTPLVAVNEHPVSQGKPGPLTQRLQKAFRTRVEKETRHDR